MVVMLGGEEDTMISSLAETLRASSPLKERARGSRRQRMHIVAVVHVLRSTMRRGEKQRCHREGQVGLHQRTGGFWGVVIEVKRLAG
jgi:hypothetical protein